MTKKYMMALLGAAAIMASVHASEGDTGKSSEKSFGVKIAETVKTAVSFVRNTVKGTANLPNTVAHCFGYGTQMSILKQSFIAALFWGTVFYAAKKAYETYKEEQSKKDLKAMINKVTTQAGEDELYSLQRVKS
jgi:hypothetical protein